MNQIMGGIMPNKSVENYKLGCADAPQLSLTLGVRTQRGRKR